MEWPTLNKTVKFFALKIFAVRRALSDRGDP